MNILSPSILSADFYKLGDQIKELEAADVKWVHIDVMDGLFVPSISFGMPVISSIRSKTDLFFDVHLMINEPERYIKEFVDCGADLINFHLEASKDVLKTIELIKEYGKKVGITIKPNTKAEELRPFIDKVDMVLIMTVEPGFGGQKLIPECVEKIKEVKKMADEMGLSIDIQADGGVNLENANWVLESGANVLVAGSAVFKNSISSNVNEFHKIMGV